MNPAAAVILALLFTSCAKEDVVVEYAVSCYHCSLRYMDAGGAAHYVQIVPDSTYTETDTVANPGPFTWSTSFEVDPEADLHFGVSRLSVQGAPTVATRTVDGLRESKTCDIRGGYVEFH